MKKISVFGLPGSGKSAFAQELAAQLQLPCLDMDRILFQNGTPLPLDRFRMEVAAYTNGPTWVIEGNYSKLAGVTWDRSDVVVWLDYPLWFLYWRLARRAWRRARGIEPKGGRSGRAAFFSRRNLAWTVTRKYLCNRAGYEQNLGLMPGGVELLRFRSPQRAGEWLEDQ